MHAPLPSSTRSRRVSGSPSRPAIPYTTTASVAGAGVSLQSWARSQYQLAQAQTPLRRPPPPQTIPAVAAAPMQLAQYQYSPRNLASAERPRVAVADYFDPYRSPAPGQQTLLAVDPAPRPTAPQAPVALQAPSSPVMRATRHSRPTTPTTTQMVHAQYSNPPSAQSSRDSLRSSGSPHTPVAQQTTQRPGTQPSGLYSPQAGKPLAQTAELLTMPEFGSSADPAFGARMKPRAYTGSDEVPAPARPRVTSMYATSGFVPSSSSPLQADALSGSRLARPIARPRQPQQGSPTPPPPPSSIAPMERSELIDFIERRRAQTFASTPAEPPPPVAPAITYGKPRASTALASESVDAPRMERSESVSSRRSDSSERSFKRSTARLADVTTITTTTVLSKQSSADRLLPPRPAPASWLSNSDLALGSTNAISSSRVVPRTRTPAADTTSDNTPLVATRSNEALPPPRVFARSKRPESAHLERTSAAITRGDFVRALPRVLSASVQTDESLLSAAGGFKPLMSDSLRKKSTAVDRAVQTAVTAADSIHSDEAVLDLMRQMDGLRVTHANQITDYQEQVLDLELLNQDLHNDVEHLHMRLEAMEAAHKRAMDDMRQRLDTTRMRVDREISDVKGMHATKCNELADQVCMLLDRCEKYKTRLVDLGDTEDQLLQLIVDVKGSAIKQEPVQKGGAIEQVQIVDQAFIERQYIETRESSQEVDYFKQLMDIERSMENTTIALGFELKRTQAKYLQQAADFIREQMARFQTDARAESRLSVRSESRLSSVVISPVKSAEPPQLPPLPVHSEPLMLPPVPPSVQPSSVASYPSASLAQALQAQHRRVAGAEPPQSRFPIPDTESVDMPIEVSIGELRKETTILAGGDRPYAGTMPPSQQRSYVDSIQQQQRRSATVSVHSHLPRGLGVHLASAEDTRSFGSESRVSGLSRMIGGSTPVASLSAGSDTSELSLADLLLLSNGSPRRSHRSPLAAIASGFFSSSQESMATTIAHSDTAITDLTQHSLLHSSLATLVTPTKPSTAIEGGAQPIAVSNSMGYFSGHNRKTRGDSLRGDTPPSKPSTIHWPTRGSDRRPSSSRSSSMAIDTQDMTAEQLLESLKLPPVTGISTPTRPNAATPSGSLGRHSSPRVRAGSYSDLTRAFPPPRFSVMSESPSSDSTLQQLHASSASIASIASVGSSTSSMGSVSKPYVYQSHKTPVSFARGSVAAMAGFDGDADIKINLGLDKTPEHNTTRSVRTGKRVGPRRRSKSVGTWGASSLK
ncbi:hypothetical protein GGI17_002400 [Coemansia sp. S146]|nr:hypothetical protein GGI17_002400 [Coemansia sp. S146]